MIELRNVSHDFDGRPVLQDISLTLGEKRIAIIGANGSGKTTLARMLNGLVAPRRGEVLIDGIDRLGGLQGAPAGRLCVPESGAPDRHAHRRGGHRLRPAQHEFAKAEIAGRLDAILAEHRFEARRASPAYLLSGGEQKLLSLLSVLVMEPRYVIFDEPLNSLDLAARRRFTRLMHDLPQTVITITHDFELIAGYDRALLIHDGRLAADGAPPEVIARYVALVDAGA